MDTFKPQNSTAQETFMLMLYDRILKLEAEQDDHRKMQAELTNHIKTDRENFGLDNFLLKVALMFATTHTCMIIQQRISDDVDSIKINTSKLQKFIGLNQWGLLSSEGFVVITKNQVISKEISERNEDYLKVIAEFLHVNLSKLAQVQWKLLI